MKTVKMAMKELQIADYSKDEKSIFSFLKSDSYTNILNEINQFLAMKFMKNFEDFFLSDEEGNTLTRSENVFCDSFVSSFFDQNYTTIRSAFTFSNDLKLQNLY